LADRRALPGSQLGNGARSRATSLLMAEHHPPVRDGRERSRGSSLGDHRSCLGGIIGGRESGIGGLAIALSARGRVGSIAKGRNFKLRVSIERLTIVDRLIEEDSVLASRDSRPMETIVKGVSNSRPRERHAERADV